MLTTHSFRIVVNNNPDKQITFTAPNDSAYHIITALYIHHSGDHIYISYDNRRLFKGIADSQAAHEALDILI